ncbi:transcriptional protein SWT1-like [Macrobrachium nipponense]|uniref:transcriptional protein SWT1-like n=1 Tax=Macrobrachium nipponense TaxID=159736 RepID=UPI0030C89482
MASFDSEPNVPKPWVKKISKKKPGTPYYFNLETFERSWTPPTEQFKKNEDSNTKTGIVVEAAPLIVKRNVDGEMKHLEEMRGKRLITGSSSMEKPGADKLTAEETSRKKARVADLDEANKIKVKIKKRQKKRKKKQKVKEISSVVSPKLNDTVKEDCSNTDKEAFCKSVTGLQSLNNLEKNTSLNDKDEGKVNLVSLLDSNRKPIRFSVNPINKGIIDKEVKGITVKPKETGKTNPAIHPSILAFQKLAKTVKWSKSNCSASRKGSLLATAIKSKTHTLGENIEENKKTSQLQDKSKDSSQSKEKCMRLSSFRIPKKKPAETEARELLKVLVDTSYGSSDEEGTNKPSKLVHDNIIPVYSLNSYVDSDNEETEHPSRPKYSKNMPVHRNEKYPDNDGEGPEGRKPNYGDRMYVYKHKELVESSESCQPITSVIEFKKRKQSLCKQSKPLFFNILDNEECEGDKGSGTYSVGDKKTNQELIDLVNKTEEKKYPCELLPTVEPIEDDDMEVEIQEIISEIASFRENTNLSLCDRKSLCRDFDRSTNSVYYVVDTNVLLRDVKFLEKLKTKEIDGKPVIIVIPYVVLQELDGLKKSISVGNASKKAICWCNRYFENKDAQVVGQNYDDYLRTLSQDSRSNADDLIRDWCLLMKKQNLDARLLTNDINLRNKAIVSSISATSVEKLQSLLEKSREKFISTDDKDCEFFENCEIKKRSPSPEMSPESMVVTPIRTSCPPWVTKQREKKLDIVPKEEDLQDHHIPEKNSSEIFLKDVEVSLSKTLGQILEAAFVDAYGHELWKQIIIHKPPWTLNEILKCWDRHWLAVFIDKFDRNVKDLLAEIAALLKVVSSNSEIKTLVQKTQSLYKCIERTEFKNHITPLQQKALGVASDCVMKETKAEVQENSMPVAITNHEILKGKGFSNVKEMINLVGVYITHFLAMILDGCGVQHDLPRLNNKQMTLEDACSSAVNLRDVIMRLGISIVNCVTSTTKENLIEFGTILVGFWDEAKEPCPTLSFTLDDLLQIVTSDEGRKFLEMVASELERLLSMLTTLMNA